MNDLVCDYKAYLQSEHWAGLRERSLNRANRKCESCRSLNGLQGHHLQYRKYFDCSEEDIICLCKKCHELWHSFFKPSYATSRDFVLDFLSGLPHSPVALRKKREKAR